MNPDSFADSKALLLLVIEDDDVDMEKITRALRKTLLTLEIIESSSASHAEILLQQHPFDCVIIDYQLKDALGSELIHKIVSHKNTPTPVIMVSGNTDERIVADAMRDGLFDYLPKRNLDTELLRKTLQASQLWAESERQALANSKQLFQAAFEYAPLGMMLISLQGCIMKINPALCQMLDYENHIFNNDRDSPPTHLNNLISKDDLANANFQLEKLRTDSIRFVQFEAQFITRNSHSVPTQTSAAFINKFNDESCYLLQVHDLSERKRYESQLIKLAHYDTLTGLGNRAKLHQEIDFLIQKSHRNAAPFAVLFGDVDHFKQINDGLGHEAGDQLLKIVARRLQKSLCHEDSVCRLGGDEFVILLQDVTKFEAVVAVAEKLIKKLRKPMRLGHNRVHIGMSFGIALYPTDGNDTKNLLRNADSALYEAKAKGRNCYQLYRKELTEYVHNRLLLDTDLRKAISNREFELHYQPVINLDTREIISAEALIRWHHPTRGMVSPDEFIAYAQETGLIVAIGEWIIQQACIQAKEWESAGHPISVSINISARQFVHQNLLSIITRALDSSRLPAHRLTVEITEQMFLENTDNNLKQISELKALGIKISLDDFGVGYSSLSYIIRFAPHYLKIDRSFVNRIGTAKEHDEMVKAIIGLSKIIPMQIVGEGVEDISQQHFLQTHGCDFGQGYLFSRPLPQQKLIDFLQQHTGQQAKTA